MTGNLIASIPKISMHALAFQGIMVYTCFPQIRDMLLRKFGDEYVLLFARPAENAAEGVIDWYTPVQGEAQLLRDLPPEAQEPVLENISRMAKEIHAYAEELINSHEPLKVTRGNILKLALRYPGEEALYVVGGQPVFTCWGFGPGTPGVEGCDLSRLKRADRPKPAAPVAPAAEAAPTPTPAAPTPPPAAPVPARGCSGCAWWLLPLLPLLLLLLLLFAGIGTRDALSGHTLFRVPAPAFLQVDDNSREIALLEKEIAELKAVLLDKAAQCVPQKPRVVQEEPRPRQEMVIPKEATNTEFLEGRWLCDTGLVNSRTHEPVKLEFSFGKDGKGTATTYEQNDKCRGETRAAIRNGNLYIAIGEQKCERSDTTYSPVTIECRPGAGTEAVCQGVHEGGTSWDANFQKIQ